VSVGDVQGGKVPVVGTFFLGDNNPTGGDDGCECIIEFLVIAHTQPT
jgi:hypothetical protein